MLLACLDTILVISVWWYFSSIWFSSDFARSADHHLIARSLPTSSSATEKEGGKLKHRIKKSISWHQHSARLMGKYPEIYQFWRGRAWVKISSVYFMISVYLSFPPLELGKVRPTTGLEGQHTLWMIRRSNGRIKTTKKKYIGNWVNE